MESTNTPTPADGSRQPAAGRTRRTASTSAMVSVISLGCRKRSARTSESTNRLYSVFVLAVLTDKPVQPTVGANSSRSDFAHRDGIRQFLAGLRIHFLRPPKPQYLEVWHALSAVAGPIFPCQDECRPCRLDAVVPAVSCLRLKRHIRSGSDGCSLVSSV